MSDQTVDVDATVLPEQGTVVEGVGDEVLMAGTLAVALVAGYMVTRVRTSSQHTRVHPDLAQPVEETRRDIGVAREREGGGGDTACPVCLTDPLSYPVETNCGHTFCAQCMLTYWSHDQWPRAARCPVCRRQVTLLLASDDLRGSVSVDGQRLWSQVTDYNQRMSGEWRPLMHYLYDVPILLRHMWRNTFTVGGLVMLHKLHLLLIAAFLLAYCLSPFDLLPEAALGVIGLVDDLLIVLAVTVYVTLIYRAHVAQGIQ